MKSYRKCAGVIVFNDTKKVLVCARNDNQSFNWQFPQGGIEFNENPLDAALRELREETSIVSVRPVKTLLSPLRYDFPVDVLQKPIAQKYIGQEVYWSLLYFFGQDDEINLSTNEPEFKAYEWVNPQEAVSRIIDFKKEVYQQAIQKLAPCIDEYKQ